MWTLAGQGLEPSSSVDPLSSSPTLSHMALRELVKRGYVRHVLSQVYHPFSALSALGASGRCGWQNCDGLHLRSGVPQPALSEVHGNMYIEVCTNCSPHRQYIRSVLPLFVFCFVDCLSLSSLLKEGKPALMATRWMGVRSFDVTGSTRFRRHGTERRCEGCRSELKDTIVHFGEWGRLAWPLNWASATDLLNKGPRNGSRPTVQ